MASSSPGLFARGFHIIPSLGQIAVLEMIGTACIGAGVVARILDHFGLCGHPPVAPLSWGILGWLAVGGFFMWLTLRDIWNPGVTQERYSPVRKLGPVMFTLKNDPSGYRYKFLGSHPAYVLMDFFAAIPPLAITVYSWGDDPMRNQTMHVPHWWLITALCVPVARLFCWHVLRRGPAVVEAMAEASSQETLHRPATPEFRKKMERDFFWSGPFAFWILTLIFVVPALALGIWQSRKTDESMPVLTAATVQKIYGVHHDPKAPESISPNHDDERFRIRGTVRGEVKQWPGGGGEKVDGVGFVVALEDGPEVAVFADVKNVKALNKAFARAKKEGKPFTCVVRTLYDGGKEISAHYKRHYNWSEADLGPVPDAAKKFTATGRRMLTYYVDP